MLAPFLTMNTIKMVVGLREFCEDDMKHRIAIVRSETDYGYPVWCYFFLFEKLDKCTLYEQNNVKEI